MVVDVDTRLVTLIGTPLGQSFAARMQNTGFKAAGANWCYFYNEAGQEHLSELIDGVRYMPAFGGAAVTKPNKVAVMELLDGLDPLCSRVGACNTVVKDCDGRLVGYNTDAVGFMAALAEKGFDAAGKSVYCIGAGGVGRPICAALADTGAQVVYVCDLYDEAVDSLVVDYAGWSDGRVRKVAFGDYSFAGSCDLVVNASGVGMGKSVGQSPAPADLAQPGQLFFDACYNPAKTQFLVDAEARGADVLNGLLMSLYQGTAQFELWTGMAAPVNAMRDELARILKEKEGDAK